MSITRDLKDRIAKLEAFQGRKAIQGAIGRSLQEVAGEVPYVIEFDHGKALFLVRVFAALSTETLEKAIKALDRWTPAHLALVVECEPTSYDLRALAQAVADREHGALEVLIDAALELRITKNSGVSDGLVGHVVLWAEECFPSIRVNR